MLPLIIIRPEPGCADTATAARAAGLEPLAFPMFAITPLAWEPPALASIDALLIASANAIRHAGPALARYAGKPTYAVGEASAAAARGAGLAVVRVGSGTLQSMVGDIAPEHRSLLRLAGRERMELVPPDGVALITRTAYASDPLAMAPRLALLLTAHSLPGAVVALHSARAANHFARECDRLGVARGRITLAALAPRIAEAAGDGWAGVHAAGRAEEEALLALAARLCQG